MLFTCNQCENSFPLKQTLVRHIKYKHGDNYFKCPHCIKTFTRKDVLHRHSKSHIYKNDTSKSSQHENSNHLNFLNHPDSNSVNDKISNIGCNNDNSGRLNESIENIRKRMRFTCDLNDTVSGDSSAGKYLNDHSKTDNDVDSEGNNSENSIDNPTKRVRLNSDKQIDNENYCADDKSGSDKYENESENDGDILSVNSDNKSERDQSESDTESGCSTCTNEYVDSNSTKECGNESDTEYGCSTCTDESVDSNSPKESGNGSRDSGNDQSSSDTDGNASDGNECRCRECRRDNIKKINEWMLENKINNRASERTSLNVVSDSEDDFGQISDVEDVEESRSTCPYRHYYLNQAKFGNCVTAVPSTGGSSGNLINSIMRISTPLAVEKKK